MPLLPHRRHHRKASPEPTNTSTTTTTPSPRRTLNKKSNSSIISSSADVVLSNASSSTSSSYYTTVPNMINWIQSSLVTARRRISFRDKVLSNDIHSPSSTLLPTTYSPQQKHHTTKRSSFPTHGGIGSSSSIGGSSSSVGVVTCNSFLMGGHYYPGKDKKRRQIRKRTLWYRMFCSSTWRKVLSTIFISYIVLYYILSPMKEIILQIGIKLTNPKFFGSSKTTSSSSFDMKLKFRPTGDWLQYDTTLTIPTIFEERIDILQSNSERSRLQIGSEKRHDKRISLLEIIVPEYFHRNDKKTKKKDNNNNNKKTTNKAAAAQQQQQSGNKNKNDNNTQKNNKNTPKTDVNDNSNNNNNNNKPAGMTTNNKTGDDGTKKTNNNDNNNINNNNNTPKGMENEMSKNNDTTNQNNSNVVSSKQQEQENTINTPQRHNPNMKKVSNNNNNNNNNNENQLLPLEKNNNNIHDDTESINNNNNNNNNSRIIIQRNDNDNNQSRSRRRLVSGDGLELRTLDTMEQIGKSSTSCPSFNNKNEDSTTIINDTITTTLVIQTSINRLWILHETCTRWKDPIIVTVFVPMILEDDEDSTQQNNNIIIIDEFWSSINEKCPNLELIQYNGNKEESTISGYPVNRLRNVGLDAVRTSHILVIDIDFIPSMNLHETIRVAIQSSSLSINNNENHQEEEAAIVVPAFERLPIEPCTTDEQCASYLQSNSSFIPYTFDELQTCYKNNDCIVFQSQVNWEGHYGTNSERWLERHWYDDNDNNEKNQQKRHLKTIKCFSTLRYEPYVVLRWCPPPPPSTMTTTKQQDTTTTTTTTNKLHITTPYYDERFYGYGKNKIELISHLRLMGYNFSILPEGFITHNPHPESLVKQTWNDKNGSTLHSEMDHLYPTFLKELQTKYKHIPHVQMCKRK